LLRLLFLLDAPSLSAISTLSLHDALPICSRAISSRSDCLASSAVSDSLRIVSRCASDSTTLILLVRRSRTPTPRLVPSPMTQARSEEHTSELQSRFDLVCRLLLEKKKE